MGLTLQSLLAELNAGTLSRVQVAHLVFFSAEYDGVFINTFYENELKRQADPAGLAAWVNLAQRNGGHFVPVLVGIATSSEYFGQS